MNAAIRFCRTCGGEYGPGLLDDNHVAHGYVMVRRTPLLSFVICAECVRAAVGAFAQVPLAAGERA
jgi:hypothetical protein